MPITQALLPEFDQEMKGTRRILERVPLEQGTWQPHPKSMTLGRLASHLAEFPMWAINAVKEHQLDIAPSGTPPAAPKTHTSREVLLAEFDRLVAEARTAVVAASDEAWMGSWSLKAGAQTIFTMPRIAVMRSFVMNHMIHHRGQLTVYLRLLGVPVPGTYGPSADEKGM
jgi:uncharacterized damage-inducible protein DinB